MLSLIFAMALVAADAPDAAAQAAAASAPSAPAKAHRDQLLCHSEEVLGSRIPTKVCYTREQQEARRQEDRANTEHLQQSQYMTKIH